MSSLYGFTEEEEAFRTTVRRFMRSEVEPIVPELEAKPGSRFDTLFPALGEIGALGSFFPETYGGSGGALLTRAIVAEETARVNAGLDASIFADIALCARCIANHGTHEQKERYLAPLLSGSAIGSMAITEPTGGSDALSPRTRGERRGSGWVLNGSKTFITNAPLADHMVVLARTSGEDRQSRGGTWFIVERGMPGLETGPAFDKMGWRSSPTGEVYLTDVVVGEEHVLGRVGQGFVYLFESLDTERALVGASAVGIAQGCLDEAVRYAEERSVFGQPLASYQLIQEKLAVIATGIEMTRAMMYTLLRAIEQGQQVTREAAILKLYATEMVTRSTTEAVQLFGGYGIMEDAKVARCFRDAKIHEIGAGSNEIIKQLIAKRTIAAQRASS